MTERLREERGVAESATRVIAIVPSAGLGKRFGANKPFVELLGEPLLLWTLRALERSPLVHSIYPVLKPEDIPACEKMLSHAGITKIARLVTGGAERQDSVMNGLRAIANPSPDTIILVHDGARPMLTNDIISRCIEGLRGADGAIAAVPSKDTIKQAGPDGMVTATPSRESLWLVQTPQVFGYDTLMRAYEAAYASGVTATDCAGLVERNGGRVRVVMGAYTNIKVTTPEDMAAAEAYLKETGR